MTDGPRLLVATGEVASDLDEVPGAIRALLESAAEVLVVAPALPSRWDWLISNTDKAREIADERLRGVLDQVDEGVGRTQGVVGADDPLVALEDAIAAFHPNHILLALRGRGSSGWQEQGLVEKVVDRFGLPVTVFRIRGGAEGQA